MNRLSKLTIGLAAACALVTGVAAQQQRINGAGATFPYPIYSKWFSEYNKLHPNVEINYQSIGSGGGIQQVTKETVFFGATDGPMTPEQLQGAPGKILHFPDGAWRRRPGLQSPGVTAELKFSGPAARRHLPREDHQVERPGDRQAERRRHPARRPTSPSRTAPTVPAPPTSGSTTWRSCRPSGRARSASPRR